MTLKENIFDGYNEKVLFRHLNSIWKKYFNIYPQLPFTKIFDIKTLDIQENERNFLLKTNIDYTVCDKNDKPLICIEFDGLSGGYNREGEYIQVKEDPLRKKKLELKLKIAIEHHYPFYIISFPEKKFISEKINLTVIDGIIGQTIAKKNFQDKKKEIQRYLDNNVETLRSMSEYELKEHVDDLVISSEVETELTWDPIARRAAELFHVLFTKRIITGYSPEFQSKPEFWKLKDINGIKWYGCKVSCDTPNGKVIERAWVRNFEGGLASPIIIVRNIAELLAFNKAADINGIQVL